MGRALRELHHHEIRKNVAEILQNHVTFELEAIDRLYLNAYVPSPQTGGGFVCFVKSQLGARVPSTMMVAPMSQQFVAGIERLVATEGIDLVTVEKGQRKDDGAQEYLARFEGEEGVLFVGKAQEKASVFRTKKRRDAAGKTYPWIIRSTAMPNHYYVYILDRDFGPLFIKCCSYPPTPASLRPRTPGRRLSVPVVDPASRVRPDPGPRSPSRTGSAEPPQDKFRLNSDRKRPSAARDGV